MTAPIDLECPRCKAGAGRFCVGDGPPRQTSHGVSLDYHHAERVDAAFKRMDTIGITRDAIRREQLRRTIAKAAVNSFDCIKCGAPKGEACRSDTAHGGHCGTHKERLTLAQESEPRPAELEFQTRVRCVCGKWAVVRADGSLPAHYAGLGAPKCPASLDELRKLVKP